jgi:hypothetical protein
MMALLAGQLIGTFITLDARSDHAGGSERPLIATPM